jgi:hypothetical protein
VSITRAQLNELMTKMNAIQMASPATSSGKTKKPKNTTEPREKVNVAGTKRPGGIPSLMNRVKPYRPGTFPSGRVNKMAPRVVSILKDKGAWDMIAKFVLAQTNVDSTINDKHFVPRSVYEAHKMLEEFVVLYAYFNTFQVGSSIYNGYEMLYRGIGIPNDKTPEEKDMMFVDMLAPTSGETSSPAPIDELFKAMMRK